MGNIRKTHAPGFKAKVALEAVKQTKTIPALASDFGIHPTQVTTWKSKLEKDASLLFTDPRKKADQDKDQLIQDLYKQVGKQSIQIDWLKKKLGITDE